MITIDNYELYFFQYQEGMLDEDTRREIEVFAKMYPSFGEELALYANAQALVAEDVSYHDKESLKHKNMFLGWRSYSVASIVLIVITVSIFLVIHRSVQRFPKVTSTISSIHLIPTIEDSLYSPVLDTISRTDIAFNSSSSNQELLVNEEAVSFLSENEESCSDSSRIIEPNIVLPVVPISSIDQLVSGITDNQSPEYISESDSLIVYNDVVTVVHDFPKSTLTDLIIDNAFERHPAEVPKITYLTCRLVISANRIKNNQFVNFVLSII